MAIKRLTNTTNSREMSMAKNPLSLEKEWISPNSTAIKTAYQIKMARSSRWRKINKIDKNVLFSTVG